MSSRMEQIIEEIEDYIDGCKFQALSNKNIIVNKEELEEMIQELRTKTPDEIKRYQKIISNKEAILADAEAKRDQVIADAQIQAAAMISEHEIMQKAYAQANEIISTATQQAQEIIDQANEESNSIKISAITYTDDLLKGFQELLANSVETTRSRSENLLANMQGYLDVVTANREALSASEPEEEAPAEDETPAATAYNAAQAYAAASEDSDDDLSFEE